MKHLLLILGLTTIVLCANAQYPGAYSTDIGLGYFDGAKFALYDSIPTPPYYGGYAQVTGRYPVGGMLGTNPFTLTFGNPSNIRSSNSDYTANGNWVSIRNTQNGVADMLAVNGQALNPGKAAQQIGLFWNGNYDGVGPTGTSAGAQTSYPLPAGCTMTYTFDNNLEPLDQFIIADIDAGEEILIEFLDASGNPLNKESNTRIVHLTNDDAGLTAPITSENSSTYGINIGAVMGYSSNTANEAYSFIITSNVVKTIKVSQVGYQNRTGGGFWVIPVKGAPDRGDAPASYGDARILPLANKLKLGTLGGDTEAIPHHSNDAAGDNIVANGIDYSGASQPQPDYGRNADEDGVPVVNPIANNGSPGQTIADYSITAKVTSNNAAYAIAWIDWDGNGIFDASEAITADITAASNDADLTFTWPSATLSGTNGRTGTYLRIIVSSESVSGASEAALYSGFGEVEDYFIPFATPLPVKFVGFDVYKEGNIAALRWSTASEENSKGFEIEKSIDGKFWTIIGFVNSIGGEDQGLRPNNYNFIDKNPVKGQNLYRLKQIDLDGKYDYSRIRSILFEKGIGINIYPNPAENNVIINGFVGGENVSIYDITGRVIYQQKVNKDSDSISLTDLNQGVYYIRITSTDGIVSSHKLVKVK